jgi:hypothetical protein
MSTRQQRASIRRNAERSARSATHSTGAAPSFDAPKHRAEAKFQFTESPDLAVLEAEYRKLFSPANALERFPVDTLVNDDWRLRRLRRADANLWDVATFDRLQRTISACERSYHRALKELQNAPNLGWGRRFRLPISMPNRWTNPRNPNIPNPVTGNWLRSGKTRTRRLPPPGSPPPQPLRFSLETPFSPLSPARWRPLYESLAPYRPLLPCAKSHSLKKLRVALRPSALKFTASTFNGTPTRFPWCMNRGLPVADLHAGALLHGIGGV